MPLTQQNEQQIKKQMGLISSNIIGSRSNVLNYNDYRFGPIIDKYKSIRDNIKDYMVEKNGCVVIDRHKVCASMTVAILYAKPINIIDESKATYKDRSANIILSFLLTQAILKDFYYEENKEELQYSMPKGYLTEYIKLISKNIDLLNSIAINPKNFSYAQSFFFLSHLYYFFEKAK